MLITPQRSYWKILGSYHFSLNILNMLLHFILAWGVGLKKSGLSYVIIFHRSPKGYFSLKYSNFSRIFFGVLSCSGLVFSVCDGSFQYIVSSVCIFKFQYSFLEVYIFILFTLIWFPSFRTLLYVWWIFYTCLLHLKLSFPFFVFYLFFLRQGLTSSLRL